MEKVHHRYNANFIHHNPSPLVSVIREVVFGMEDGMVSTLGAITGIAVGSKEHSTVLLAGFVIIAVESLSMSIGSYLSRNSEEEVQNRKLSEEKSEIENYPAEEKQELLKMYTDDGWPKPLAEEMVQAVAKNPPLMLKEMALRELQIFPSAESHSVKGALSMFVSYVIGGLIPLFAYLFLPIQTAIPISIGVTLIGLFVLGALTTKFTKQPMIQSGLRMLLVGGLALVVGLLVGAAMGKVQD